MTFFLLAQTVHDFQIHCECIVNIIVIINLEQQFMKIKGLVWHSHVSQQTCVWTEHCQTGCNQGIVEPIGIVMSDLWVFFPHKYSPSPKQTDKIIRVPSVRERKTPSEGTPMPPQKHQYAILGKGEDCPVVRYLPDDMVWGHLWVLARALGQPENPWASFHHPGMITWCLVGQQVDSQNAAF